MIDVLIIGFIFFVAIFLFAVAIGSNLFTVMVAEQVRYLDLIMLYAPHPAPASRQSLPEPVYRYLLQAVGSDAARPSCTTLRFRGRARFGKTGRWLHTRGRGIFPFAVPGYVWHTTSTYAPCIWLESFDFYVNRAAGMTLNLLSFFPLNNAYAKEIQSPALFRYLAFLPFFPQRAAAAGALSWEPIDETAARLRIRDGEIATAAIVRFSGRGWIESIDAECPPDTVSRRRPPGLYRCRYTGESRAGGCRVPRGIVIEQRLPDGEYFCAELEITQVEYDTRGAVQPEFDAA